MKILLTVALFFFSAFSGLGQKPAPEDPPDLALKREQHLRNLQRAAIPVLQQYLKTLDALSQQYSRDKKFDDLIAVQNEIKNVQGQIATANSASDLSNGQNTALAIISAKLGDFDAKRVIDVTEIVRKTLRAGQPILRTDHKDLHVADPMDGSHNKKMRVVYTIYGVRKEKEVVAGAPINFKDDLQ